MGIIEKHQMKLPWTQKERTLWVYLPENYKTDSEKRYPVLYMHDGQNLFDCKEAIGGIAWDVVSAADEFSNQKEFIIAALDNGREERSMEYTPWERSCKLPNYVEIPGGHGDLYASYMVEQLKPWMDEHYRTMPQREHTFVAGSSLGGLISAYMAAKYPDIYSKAGIFSLASWFNEEKFLEYIRCHGTGDKVSYYIRTGTNEAYSDVVPQMPQIYVDCALHYINALWGCGVPAQQVHMAFGVGDEHNEKTWTKHTKEFFEFLF